jgi:hypothetical protein
MMKRECRGGIICEFYSIYQNYLTNWKKKHINKITLKHQTSRLSYQLKLSNINNSNKLKIFYINKIKIIK